MKTYKYEKCNILFSRKNNLNRHLRKKHPSDEEQIIATVALPSSSRKDCPFCDLFFWEKEQLIEHMWSPLHPIFTPLYFKRFNFPKGCYLRIDSGGGTQHLAGYILLLQSHGSCDKQFSQESNSRQSRFSDEHNPLRRLRNPRSERAGTEREKRG